MTVAVLSEEPGRVGAVFTNERAPGPSMAVDDLGQAQVMAIENGVDRDELGRRFAVIPYRE